MEMDIWVPFLGYSMKVTFEIFYYLLIATTLYYYVYIPISSFLLQIQCARKFHSLPSHPIYGHLRDLIPGFPTVKYNLADSSTRFYNLLMKSNDPVEGSAVSVIWIGWIPFYCASGSTAIETILNKSNIKKPFFYKFIGFKDGLVSSDPDKWKCRRKIIEPYFRQKNHKHFVSIMNKEIGKATHSIQIDKPVDIEHIIHLSALNIICEVNWGVSQLLDVKKSVLDAMDRGEAFFIQRVYNPFFWNPWIFSWFDTGRNYTANLVEADYAIETMVQEANLLKKAITEDNNNPSDRKVPNSYQKSLYEFLKFNHKASKNQIDDEGIDEELLTMTAAGHETTSIGLRWTLFILGNHLDVQERLYQEVIDVFPDDTPVDDLEKIRKCKYLDQCLQESLRIRPPIHAVARQLEEDVIINGSKICKDSILILNLSATHYDPKIFPDPLKYDPDRWSPENELSLPKGAYAPFSIGPRNCIGYRYALLELKIYLIHIIRRYSFKSILKLEDVTIRFEIALKPNAPLELKFARRK